MSNTDAEFLHRTILLAEQNLGNGNFPCAAIVTDKNQEIAYGLSSTESTRDITAHAEIQAIRHLNGTDPQTQLTLYSSLEPCLMCLAAAAWAGVRTVVFACSRNLVSPQYYETKCSAEQICKLVLPSIKILETKELASKQIALITKFEERITK